MDEHIIELKNTVIELIENIVPRIESISMNCRETGTADEGRLADLFDDLEALAEGISIVKGSYKNIDMLEFREKLDIMAEALEAGDAMLLADVMRFELKSLLEDWKAQINISN